MDRYYCKYCGKELQKTSVDDYKCNFCNSIFSKQEAEKYCKYNVEANHLIALELSPLVFRRNNLVKLINEYKNKPQINDRLYIELKNEVTKLENIVRILDTQINEEKGKIK